MHDPTFDTLVSPRLLIRRFRPADAPALAAYRSDPEVARYQSWESCSLAEAATFIEGMRELAPGIPGAWFQFAVAVADSHGSLIGDVALRRVEDDPRQAELGFTFSREHQGRGYATEAVGRISEYAFTTLDVHRLFSITDTRNEPARRLLDRLGFHLDSTGSERAWFKGEWVDELRYVRLR